MDAVKNYDAGKNDRLNSGWTPIWNQSAEMTDKPYRENIRARARDLERNSDIANSIISAWVRNVVGRGFTLQVKTDDESINTQIEKLWRRWCKSRNCDVNGVQTFHELIRTAVQRKYVDGGILIAKVYTSAGVLPFQLQLIEVDELDTGAMKSHFKGHTVVDGVEINQFGKPVGYHIKQYLPDGGTGTQSRFYSIDDIIFYFSKTRPSQVREMSQLAQTIPRIRDITSFMEAASMKERIAALMAVAITRSGSSGKGLGRDSRQVSSMPGSGGYQGVSLTPGMIFELNPGDDVHVINPSTQGGNASEFVRMQQRLSGAGQGLSYEATSRDMSQVNYSSARQGLIEDERTYGIEQDNLVEHVLREIYETFLISAIVSGNIIITDFWENKQEYMTHLWVPQGRKWIDPAKEANANQTALKTAQRTFQQICMEQGRDWKEVLDEIAQAQAYANEKGVDLYGWIQGSQTQPITVSAAGTDD
ncbi:MAG: phage portal protein [Oscillospiraceae bacterium]